MAIYQMDYEKQLVEVCQSFQICITRACEAKAIEMRSRVNVHKTTYFANGGSKKIHYSLVRDRNNALAINFYYPVTYAHATSLGDAASQQAADLLGDKMGERDMRLLLPLSHVIRLRCRGHLQHHSER